jgi:hypothetical protein
MSIWDYYTVLPRSPSPGVDAMQVMSASCIHVDISPHQLLMLQMETPSEAFDTDSILTQGLPVNTSL